MLVNKAFKVRLYPNKEQRVLLDKTFGCCRFLYNQELAERKHVYESLKDDKEKLHAYKYKTEKLYKAEFSFLKEVDSKSLQCATGNLMVAFKNFFEKRAGYPHFKSRRSRQSYTTININDNCKVDFDAKRLKLPRMPWIKFHDDRRFDGRVSRITVSKSKSGKYFASLLTKVEIDDVPRNPIRDERIASYDMSAKNFLESEHEKFTNEHFYRRAEKKIKKLGKRLSRKQKGSKNREKARTKLARAHETITNQRNNWTHQATCKLSNEKDAIILENLNIKGMQKFNSGLSKTVTLDFSWGIFIRTLEYKMKWKGKHLKLVGQFFPSSKLCSACGYKNDDLTLEEREWTCPSCGIVLIRDENSSKNLGVEGRRLLREDGVQITKNITIRSTGGTPGIHAFGENVRPASNNKRAISMN